MSNWPLAGLIQLIGNHFEVLIARPDNSTYEW